MLVFLDTEFTDFAKPDLISLALVAEDARQTLAGLVFRQSVTVEEAGRDRYGRVIGTVYVSGGSVNAQMVELGMAWVYRRYAKDSVLFELERQARADKRGLWADTDPVAPWEYRHNKRAQAALPN
jgi:endonuclease YncB( thermonuclease family)